MREIADAGNIKAKVTIEYDGGGIEKAKEDLKSLTEAAGGVGQGAAQAGEELGNLDEKAGGAREGLQALTAETRPLSEGLADVEKSGGGANDVLAEQASVVDELKASHEAAQETIAATNQAFEEGGTSAVDFSRNVEAMNKSFDASAVGLSDFYENMSVMQDALVNPEPFNMIQQHLSETGQSWSDFVSSVGPENETMLRSMADNAGFLQQYTHAIGEEFLPGNAVERAQAYTDQFLAMSDATRGATGAVDEFTKAVDPLINAQGGVGASMYGPAPYSLIDMINKNGGIGSMVYGPELPPAEPKALGIMGGISEVGEGIGGFFGGILETMNQIAMPLMAMQMIGMAVQAVGQSIYNAAAVAEGPGAHSFGTFTGSVDALAQSSAKAGQAFSESFGQQVVPMLQALSDTTQGSGGIAGFLGQWAGGIADFAVGVGAMGIGGIVDALTLPIQLLSGSPSFGGGFIHFGMQALGLAPAGGVTPEDTTTAALEQQTAALEQQIESPAYPAYLAAQAKASSMQAKAVEAQRAFDTSHFSGATDLASDNYIGGQLLSGYVPSASNMSDLAQNYRFFMNQPYEPPGGCFPAGTRVLMANGGERDIDMLQPGEQVLAHDGERQVSTVVRARIVPHPKQVYELAFSDGRTLTTTDSHPIATTDGWKALSVAAAKQDNPDLDVSTLHIGDFVYTSNETTCTLLSIEMRDIVQIYNIEVAEPHTFYAGGILVHNKVQSSFAPAQQDVGSQIADQIGGIKLPSIDFGGMAGDIVGGISNIRLPHIEMPSIASDIVGGIESIHLPHFELPSIASDIVGGIESIHLPQIQMPDISAALSGLTAGLTGFTLPPIPDIGGMLSGALTAATAGLTGFTLPSMPDIGGMLSSAMSTITSGISGFTLPPMPDIGGMLNGALSGISAGLTGFTLPPMPDIGGMLNAALTGVTAGLSSLSLPPMPDIGAMINGAMAGLFGGISLPPVPDLGGAISGAMAGMFGGISLPSIPFFAEGVTNFSGGAAVIAEDGPEMVSYNGQHAYFDQGAALVNLPPGSSVYPMQSLSNYAYSAPSGISVGGMSQGISLGGGDGGTVTINLSHTTTLDGRVIAQQTIPYVAPLMRLAAGVRQ